MIASLFNHLHLGDKVACCLALQSMAEQEEWNINIRGCESVRDIVEGLNLDRLIWCGGFEQQETEVNLSQLFDFLEGASIPFFASPSMSLNFRPPKMKARTTRSALGIRRQPKTLFQFDSRSTNENKKRLSRKESMMFLKSKSKFRAIGVGGVETKRELPYEYFLGNLRQIIDEMKSASQFVGVDSGMSHMAGALGLPSEIYLMHTSEQEVRMVDRFYKEFYPNTRCSHDFSASGGRNPPFKIF